MVEWMRGGPEMGLRQKLQGQGGEWVGSGVRSGLRRLLIKSQMNSRGQEARPSPGACCTAAAPQPP